MDMLQTVMRPSTESANRFAGIFDDIAGATGRADLTDDGEDDVLGRDACRQCPVHHHAHVLGFFLNQRLRGEHMLHLGCADAISERSEGAMRRGVAIAANDGRAWQREALLGADDMNDALAMIQLVVILHAKLGAILCQRLYLERRDSGSSMPWLRSVVGTL